MLNFHVNIQLPTDIKGKTMGSRGGGGYSSLKSVERKVIPKNYLHGTKVSVLERVVIWLFPLIREEERQLVSNGHLTFRGEINPFLGAYIKVCFHISFGLKHSKIPTLVDTEIQEYSAPKNPRALYKNA